METPKRDKRPYEEILAERAEEVRALVLRLLIEAGKESWNNGLAAGRRRASQDKASESVSQE
jgi:hypothetical protein